MSSTSGAKSSASSVNDTVIADNDTLDLSHSASSREQETSHSTSCSSSSSSSSNKNSNSSSNNMKRPRKRSNSDLSHIPPTKRPMMMTPPLEIKRPALPPSPSTNRTASSANVNLETISSSTVSSSSSNLAMMDEEEEHVSVTDKVMSRGNHDNGGNSAVLDIPATTKSSASTSISCGPPPLVESYSNSTASSTIIVGKTHGTTSSPRNSGSSSSTTTTTTSKSEEDSKFGELCFYFQAHLQHLEEQKQQKTKQRREELELQPEPQQKESNQKQTQKPQPQHSSNTTTNPIMTRSRGKKRNLNLAETEHQHAHKEECKDWRQEGPQHCHQELINSETTAPSSASVLDSSSSTPSSSLFDQGANVNKISHGSPSSASKSGSTTASLHISAPKPRNKPQEAQQERQQKQRRSSQRATKRQRDIDSASTVETPKVKNTKEERDASVTLGMPTRSSSASAPALRSVSKFSSSEPKSVSKGKSNNEKKGKKVRQRKGKLRPVDNDCAENRDKEKLNKENEKIIQAKKTKPNKKQQNTSSTKSASSTAASSSSSEPPKTRKYGTRSQGPVISPPPLDPKPPPTQLLCDEIDCGNGIIFQNLLDLPPDQFVHVPGVRVITKKGVGNGGSGGSGSVGMPKHICCRKRKGGQNSNIVGSNVVSDSQTQSQQPLGTYYGARTSYAGVSVNLGSNHFTSASAAAAIDIANKLYWGEDNEKPLFVLSSVEVSNAMKAIGQYAGRGNSSSSRHDKCNYVCGEMMMEEAGLKFTCKPPSVGSIRQGRGRARGHLNGGWEDFKFSQTRFTQERKEYFEFLVGRALMSLGGKDEEEVIDLLCGLSTITDWGWNNSEKKEVAGDKDVIDGKYIFKPKRYERTNAENNNNREDATISTQDKQLYSFAGKHVVYEVDEKGVFSFRLDESIQ